MKNKHVSLNPSYSTCGRGFSASGLLLHSGTCLVMRNPDQTQSLSLFIPWMWHLLRHCQKLTAKIQLELWVLISHCFSNGNIVSTIYWYEWDVMRWLGKKLFRQRKQYILGLWCWRKVQYAHKRLFICMLEHRWEIIMRKKGNWGTYLEKTIITKDPCIMLFIAALLTIAKT